MPRRMPDLWTTRFFEPADEMEADPNFFEQRERNEVEAEAMAASLAQLRARVNAAASEALDAADRGENPRDAEPLYPGPEVESAWNEEEGRWVDPRAHLPGFLEGRCNCGNCRADRVQEPYDPWNTGPTFSAAPAPETLAYRRCAHCGADYNLDRFRGEDTTCRSCKRDIARARARTRRHGRRFGVEIEVGYDGDSNDIAAALERAGIECEDSGYTHEVMEDCWKIVSDGSLDYGWEVVSPPLTWDQRDQIVTVCQVLTDLGARANRQCGLHVHHEVTDLSISGLKRLVRNWYNAQPLTNLLCNPSRRDNQWCGSLYPNEVETVERVTTIGQFRNLYMERYKALNLTAYAKYGTVEIRQLEGTTDPDRILAWVLYGQAMVQHAVSRKAVRPLIPPGSVAVSRPRVEDVEQHLDCLPIPHEDYKSTLKQRARVHTNSR